MVKEVGFLPVRRYEIPAGELLFNTPYCFLSVRFGYGNQLLALGLSHWFLIAVLDLLGFPTNFYERHYFFLLGCRLGKACPYLCLGAVFPFGLDNQGLPKRPPGVPVSESVPVVGFRLIAFLKAHFFLATALGAL